MADIFQKIQSLHYTGGAVALATAPFVDRLRRVSRVNDGGTGLVSWVPGSDFNAFDSLQNEGDYIISSLTFPYTIPTQDNRVAPIPYDFANSVFSH